MDRKKTSKERDFCFESLPILGLQKDAELNTHYPERSLRDLDKVGAALLESLVANDTEAFIEILDGYLHVNRSRVSRKGKISRSTVQQALSRRGNPTLRTLAKIVHESFS
jgi:DNA-binding phage protein